MLKVQNVELDLLYFLLSSSYILGYLFLFILERLIILLNEMYFEQVVLLQVGQVLQKHVFVIVVWIIFIFLLDTFL